jgi:cholesterol transport system auxiliary component
MPKNDRLPRTDTPRLGRRLFLIAGSSLALTACGSLDKLIGPPDAPQMYALRPALAPAQPGGKVSWALAIAKPEAADNLDSSRIALARGDTQLDFYANAMWPDHLTDLVQTALLAGFEGSGRIDAVSREEDTLHSDYILLTELRDFEARYGTPDGAPTIAVTIVAQIADAHSRKILSTQTASFNEPASANSVDAAVQAFNTALGKAIAQIVQWALALPPPAAARTDAPDVSEMPPRRPPVPPKGPGAGELPVPGGAPPAP